MQARQPRFSKLLRGRRPEDHGACVALLREVHLADGYPREPGAWPAWRQARSVEVERLAVLTRLFVDPTHRSSGLGGALLEQVQQHAALNDLRLVLEVEEHRFGAIALYERYGWRPVGAALRPASDGKQPLRVLLFVGSDHEAFPSDLC